MQRLSGKFGQILLPTVLFSTCAQRSPSSEEVQSSDAEETEVQPIVLPTRAPESCAPDGVPVTPQLNNEVISEWGTLIQKSEDKQNEFIRIVKNKAESGYALWYCEGRQPNDGDYNKVPCWILSQNAFEAEATDKKLKNCDLFDLLKNNGFGLPGSLKIKYMLVRGPYPVQFPIDSMGTKRFCSGARNALQKCLGR